MFKTKNKNVKKVDERFALLRKLSSTAPCFLRILIAQRYYIS